MPVERRTGQQENRERLVDALRSGEYQQAQGQLRSNDGYCCLGVACDISGLGDWQWGFDRWVYAIDNRTPQAMVLPDQVAKYFGFATKDGELEDDDGRYVNLADANDQHVSFEDIADMIENGDVRFQEA